VVWGIATFIYLPSQFSSISMPQISVAPGCYCGIIVVAIILTAE
jgi:hypothetical protein